MCAPIALTGLQIAGAIASSAAQRAELKRQARQAEVQAQSDAKQHAARAEFARDDAERNSAEERVVRLSQSTDPKSESALATLTADHARRLDVVQNAENQVRQSLYQGTEQSRAYRRAARRAITQSLFSLAGTTLSAATSGSIIRVPS